MRKSVIAANWKMHKTVLEARTFVQHFKKYLGATSETEIIIAPGYTALESVSKEFSSQQIYVAGQNLHSEPYGAFTGEISGSMLKSAGVSHVIIGHSERRQMFHETDEIINKKVIAALECELTPILCVGETLLERESGQTFTVLKTQLEKGLKNIHANHSSNLIVAYEPVWAIGTGRNATPEQAQTSHKEIRTYLSEILDSDVASGIRIIYGGSVKPENIGTLICEPDIDGALVGGASLDAESFLEIVAKSRAPEV
tara:strand:- start:646 stop:1413 length:768 start_codon:yes stop_codon:yes gene_type:complete